MTGPSPRAEAETGPAPAAHRVPGPRSLPAVLAPILALAALSLVAVIAAAAAGGPAATILARAGALARHGAPVAALLADLSGALVLGGGVVAGWVLGDEEDRDARPRVLRAVTAGTVVWTLAQLALVLTSYAIATGQPVTSPSFGSDLPVYLATDLGGWLLVSLVLAAATTVLAVGGTGPRAARLLALCASASLLAKAMTGHASGSAGHETATSTMLVHLIAGGIWIGGLAVLQLVPGDRPGAAAVVRRFSRLALVCWIALLASGAWALAVRMNGPGDLLTSAYVQLGAAKAMILALLGGAGALQRRLLAQEASARPHDGALYRRLAVLELALMGLAVALAAAMSSSPPPAAQVPGSAQPAELLTDYPLPPAPDLAGILVSWRPDAFAIAAVAILALAWWWPTAPHRSRRSTGLLVAGLAAALLVQCGPLAVYGKVLVSAHLAQHVALLTVIGPLLGAALATSVPGHRADRRRWAAAGTAVLAVGALALVYSTPLVRLALDSHIAHLALIVGVVAAGAVLGAAARSSRIAAVTGGLALGAGALVLALGSTLIAPSWFGATGRPWLADAHADQQRAGWALLVWALAWTAVAVAAGRRPRGDQERGARSSSNSERTLRRRASRSSRSTKGS